MLWEFSPDLDDLPSRFRHFSKNHERELVSCLANLEKILALLNDGIAFPLVVRQCSFLRSEREGLYRIGQTGVKSSRECRLYVHPDEKTRTVFILGVGRKESQQRDISDCKKQIKEIRRAQ
ncbi:hypothetical protein FGF68_04430 [Prosthecochloris vibrioformis]|uniref:Type II toxin-antitoxin system RelE/ParE family toxin n=2 Tax=Chlorobiaceae TaxID=191412 RepID=A0A5C4S1D3_PROVB|nr:hypothetical protein FGF68_04430 [Prosthecochloris vibrioformis]